MVRSTCENFSHSCFFIDPCGHGVQSLGRTLCLYLSIYETFLKPCEDLVNTVNVVNVDPS